MSLGLRKSLALRVKKSQKTEGRSWSLAVVSIQINYTKLKTDKLSMKKLLIVSGVTKSFLLTLRLAEDEESKNCSCHLFEYHKIDTAQRDCQQAVKWKRYWLIVKTKTGRKDFVHLVRVVLRACGHFPYEPLCKIVLAVVLLRKQCIESHLG